MNAVAHHEGNRLPSLPAGGRVSAIVPQDFDGAWRIASAVCKAGMAPKGLETPEKAMVAIMHGMEVGLTPMAALQSIAVINSRATLWGDGALGVVQASGKMESFKEWFEGAGDSRKALCLVKRKGDPEAKLGEFSVADARKASLWGKSGPWSQYSDRMLKMRARAFALRDGFSDVLRGLGIAEEVQDIPAQQEAVSVTPPSPPSPPSQPSPAITASKEDVVEEAEIVNDGEDFDIEAFLSEVDEAMATGKTEEEIVEIWDGFDVEATLTEDEEALQRAFDLRKHQIARVLRAMLNSHPVNAG
ncbi:hypothetical protein [Brucella intermedia]|uniref:hypothetical protein n=1 Tax=Brucella intermedia TaxID=94625 RepID=UPI00165CF363|nr:hypothetical protein [Brucella intermedia]QNQ39374.1 hypothetical protein IAR37_08275 [Brucella intermedia]